MGDPALFWLIVQNEKKEKLKDNISSVSVWVKQVPILLCCLILSDSMEMEGRIM